MIPESNNLNLTEVEQVTYPSVTYKIDFVNKSISKKIDGQEAAIQAVTKIFSTERYRNVIYSGNYGVQIENLVGKDYDYVVSELKRRLEDAISTDDRFIRIDNFSVEKTGINSLLVNCTIVSVEGAFDISLEV